MIGFDIEIRPYPAQLVIQDVLTLHGSQFKNAAIIVASPPCQAYSYRAMPWKRAKALPPPSNELFDACFRIQREACKAAGRYIPMVVENVRGAQPWVGQAAWNFGSFYLWGDVPALMLYGRGRKLPGNNGPRRWEDRKVQRLGDAPLDTFGWSKGTALRNNNSHSSARKAASAQIAKIPFELARYIAQCFRP